MIRLRVYSINATCTFGTSMLKININWVVMIDLCTYSAMEPTTILYTQLHVYVNNSLTYHTSLPNTLGADAMVV